MSEAKKLAKAVKVLLDYVDKNNVVDDWADEGESTAFWRSADFTQVISQTEKALKDFEASEQNPCKPP